MMDNGDADGWRVKSNNLGTSGNAGVQGLLQPETQKTFSSKDEMSVTQSKHQFKILVPLILYARPKLP